LARIMKDNKGYPINYNHYYTENIKRRRQDREDRRKIEIEQTAKQASHTTTVNGVAYNETPTTGNSVDVDVVANKDVNMDHFSCQDALDCLIAIYKVCLLLRFSLLFYCGHL
jgi:hypothetical protein